jgi:hypothetical protein
MAAQKRPVPVEWNHDKGMASDDFVVKMRVNTQGDCPTRKQLEEFEKLSVACVARAEQNKSQRHKSTSELRIVFDYARGLQGDCCNADGESEEWKFEEGEDPALYMLIHFERMGCVTTVGDFGMCIASEAEKPHMTPRAIAQHLQHARADMPSWITEIGVSAVSQLFMMQQWWGCVAFDPHDTAGTLAGPSFDTTSGKDRWGFARGYMCHRMYLWNVYEAEADNSALGGAGTVRERSFNFAQWLLYDIVRKADPEFHMWC